MNIKQPLKHFTLSEDEKETLKTLEAYAEVCTPEEVIISCIKTLEENVDRTKLAQIGFKIWFILSCIDEKMREEQKEIVAQTPG